MLDPTNFATLMLAHPSNRGGTGINSGPMHVKGAAIVKSGADLSHLGASCALRWQPMLRPNRPNKISIKLHQKSQTMMAKPTGAERILSVSPSHTSQFIKASVAEAVTDQPSRKGPDGHLNPALLRQDKTLHTMVTVGWSWTIIAQATITHRKGQQFHQLHICPPASLVDHVSTSAEASHDFERLAVDMPWVGAKLQPMQPSWESLSTSTQAR